MDSLAAEGNIDESIQCWRAIYLAQLGMSDEARQLVRSINAIMNHASAQQNRVRVLVPAWLGDFDESRRQLEKFVTRCRDSEELYHAACLAAQVARAATQHDARTAADLRRQSLDLLRTAVLRGWHDVNQLQSDPDLVPLREETDFAALVTQLAASRYYAGLWRSRLPFETRVLCDLPLEEQRRRCEEHHADGFRPMAVAVGVLDGPAQPTSATIWYRPLPPIPVADLVERTMFIEYFPQWSGSVEKLVDALQAVDDAPLRSGIVLAIGSIENAAVEAKQAWEPVLSDWHGTQPDSGVHGAVAFALRSWGLPVPTSEKRGQLPAEFEWRATKKGLTMIRIPAGRIERPLIPSLDYPDYDQTPDENERAEGRKTICIENEFWLSDCEVTAGLFLEFLSDKEAEQPQVQK